MRYNPLAEAGFLLYYVKRYCKDIAQINTNKTGEWPTQTIMRRKTTEEASKETTEQETDVKEPEQTPGQKPSEKTLTQAEVNKILADERRKHDTRYQDLKTEYAGFKAAIEAKEAAANEAAAEKVEALRKDLPDPLIKLLDKLSPVEQLEWLNDPANVITKKEIPPLPASRDAHGGPKKTINIV